jgi:hypothetical protein
MSDTVLIAALTIAVNAAVTWGVLRTELKYLRRDVDHAHKRIDGIYGEYIDRRAHHGET